MSVSNAEFISQLTTLLATRQGSLSITTKRFTYEAPQAGGEDAAMTDVPEASTSQEREWPVLYRITDGNQDKSKKIKLSTIVQPTHLGTFTPALTATLRQAITFLRPKKKKLAKKPTPAAPAKPTSATSSAPTFARLPRLAGPKRGPGAHKRQRLKKRRGKQLTKLAARRKRDRS